MSQFVNFIPKGSSGMGPVQTLTGNNAIAVGPDGTGTINIVHPVAYGTIFGQGKVTGSALSNTLTITPYVTPQPTLQTIDATANELLWSLPVLASSTVTFFAIVNGSQSDYSNAVTGTVVGSALRGAAGAPILAGNPIITMNNTPGFFPFVNVIISANNLQFVVTGLAATTINWTALIYFLNN